MKVAASTWFAIWRYFRNERPDPLKRHMSVRATLGTLMSLQGQHSKNDWYFSKKAGTLPYVEMQVAIKSPTRTMLDNSSEESSGEKAPSYQAMIENLKAARRAGFEYIDPLDGSVVIRKGFMAKTGDYDSGIFKSEKDLLTWMILSNVTVCAFGAGVTTFFYKGISHVIRTSPCVNLAE